MRSSAQKRLTAVGRVAPSPLMASSRSARSPSKSRAPGSAARRAPRRRRRPPRWRARRERRGCGWRRPPRASSRSAVPPPRRGAGSGPEHQPVAGPAKGRDHRRGRAGTGRGAAPAARASRRRRVADAEELVARRGAAYQLHRRGRLRRSAAARSRVTAWLARPSWARRRRRGRGARPPASPRPRRARRPAARGRPGAAPSSARSAAPSRRRARP